ncbi:MAG: Unknown protein [uncultured Sulfurovum sp.]|uniref:HNH nuclease domain-containing protein n=1 Tax=uncultured Sulfurovum sp. TaxID=269237 RepID=A0A6S6UJA2_9BACT|nr:MAG: Unknown protein [uncultured Sulfurovum sp.]
MSALKYWFNPKAYIKTSRGSTKLAKWAKKVYKKNNYTCVACGYQGGGDERLEAHHIVPKSINPRLAYRVSNGVTLCSGCHRVDDDAYHALNGYEGSHALFNSWLSVKREKVKNNDFKINNFLFFFLVSLSISLGIMIAYFV